MDPRRGNAGMAPDPQPAQPSLAGLIGLFQMNIATDTAAPAKSAMHENTQESVFDPDYRTIVDPSLYKDGGIYRSIVKLQMRYERQTGSDEGWYMGTGWLITPDIMVTAGHNVYNWSGGDGENGLGKAVTIKCHIGYHGKESVGTDPNVQSRLAKRCITSAEWLENKDNRHRDFAFIQVDRPFTGDLRLFTYEPTPVSGDEVIGVVGYPGDKTITDSSGREERGAMMYKQFAPTHYDRKTAKLQMLTYRVSTFGGQSGAPVIREGKQVGIATHVYGFGDKNQASPIVDYANFFDAFSKEFPHVGSVDGINLHRPVTAATALAATRGLQASNSVQGGQEEGFFDILEKIGSVVADVGQTVIPMVAPAILGPIGGPISAIAGSALGALGRACSESAAEDVDTKTAVKLVEDGEAERGVLAEAALQGLEKLRAVDPHHPVLNKIHGDMARTYGTIAPNLRHLAPHFQHELVRSAALIGCRTNFVAKSHAHITTATTERQPIQSTLPGAESTYGGGGGGGATNAFEESLMAPTKPLQGEEAFFDNVGTFFTKALEVAKPVLRASALAGLNEISKRLAAMSTTESTMDNNSSSNAETAAATLVLQRAAMGEAALQAVGKLNAQELANLQIAGSGGNAAEQESYMDLVKTTVQKLGGVVRAAAPVVINHVLPAVMKAVAGGGTGAGGQESAQYCYVVGGAGPVKGPVNGPGGSGGPRFYAPPTPPAVAPLAPPAPSAPPAPVAWASNGMDSRSGAGINSPFQGRYPSPPVRVLSSKPSRSRIEMFGPSEIAVGALLPPEDGASTEQDIIASRGRALHRVDSNEDLPVYQIYD